MKHSWSGAFAAIACAMTMTLSAQTPPAGGAQTPPAGGAQTPSTASSASSQNKVTVTGCLEKAQASTSPTGTTGAAGAAADSTKFVLNQVSSGTSSPGTAGTAGARSTASSYRLDGEDSKLSGHVGHKVEISGTVESMAGSKSETGAAAASASSAPKLKVDSVKMIAASCTP